MPALHLPPQPEIPGYTPAPETTEPLEYADLVVVDLEQCATPEGRAKLAITVRDAMTTVGFFYVVNHGYTPAQTKRIFDIADYAFTAVTPAEKEECVGRMEETGSHQGYKPQGYWHIDGGVRDKIESFNINRDVTKKNHPKTLQPLLPEIEAFGRYNHYNILFPLLRLLAVGMELPEETFVNMHGYHSVAETFIRFMKYYPRSEEDEKNSNNLWLKGHTDFGSVTILWSQPVAALQILSPDGKWRWIKHIDNALVINCGDALDFLSGNFYKPTIHRVVQPPTDQQTYTRLSVFYFALPDDHTKLVPLEDSSPVLQRVGAKRRPGCEDDAKAPTMEEWRKGRTSKYGRSELKVVGGEEGQKSGKAVVEEEIIGGVLVKHYK